MLMHEWLKYRDRQVKREEPAPTDRGEPEAGATAAEEAVAPPLRVEEAKEPEAELEAGVEPEAVLERPSPTMRARAVPATLQAPEFQTRRLQTLLGRQQRLPLEVEAEPVRRGNQARESREELIERLLDPVLSIDEAATLLGVCATSVRRYTNRGVLKCFRTPGNQRRFRLSDVLDFMEKQQAREPE